MHPSQHKLKHQIFPYRCRENSGIQYIKINFVYKNDYRNLEGSLFWIHFVRMDYVFVKSLSECTNISILSLSSINTTDSKSRSQKKVLSSVIISPSSIFLKRVTGPNKIRMQSTYKMQIFHKFLFKINVTNPDQLN